MADIERVLQLNSHLGEGPIWSVRDQAVYWVDITSGIIHRWRPATKEHRPFTLGYSIGCLGIRAKGGLMLAAQHGFMTWDEDKGAQPFANPLAGQSGLRFNDGKVDPSGRMFAGTMDENDTDLPVGSLYRLDADASVHVVDTKLRCPNGIGWSLDHKTMYFTDSPLLTIFAFDYEAGSGKIENKRPFIKTSASDGVPDGMTVDSEGCIWSAHWGGWKVSRYDPSGKLERVIKLPVERPTSCAFGGKNLDELYVTSAALDMPPAELAKQPFAGDLLLVHAGVKGQEEPQFAG